MYISYRLLSIRKNGDIQIQAFGSFKNVLKSARIYKHWCNANTSIVMEEVHYSDGIVYKAVEVDFMNEIYDISLNT